MLEEERENEGLEIITLCLSRILKASNNTLYQANLIVRKGQYTKHIINPTITAYDRCRFAPLT